MITRQSIPLILASLLSLHSLVASAESVEDVKAAKESLQQKLYEITGKDTVVLSLNKGAYKLSEANIAELKTTFNAVKADAMVKEILILAYADQPYPHDQKEDLSKTSIKLANKRAQAVRDQLDKFAGKNMKVYNMATKASWFEKTFITSTAQVKREAKEIPSEQDADDAFYQALGKHLVAQGGPGKVVVIVRKDF